MRPPEPDPPPCGRHKWMTLYVSNYLYRLGLNTTMFLECIGKKQFSRRLYCYYNNNLYSVQTIESNKVDADYKSNYTAAESLNLQLGRQCQVLQMYLGR